MSRPKKYYRLTGVDSTGITWNYDIRHKQGMSMFKYNADHFFILAGGEIIKADTITEIYK